MVTAVLAYMTWRYLPAGPIPSGQYLELALELLMAVACGLWQGMTVKVYRRDGRWYLRGGWAYLGAWGAFLCGDIALHLIMEGPAAFSGPAAPAGMWISIAGAAVVWAVRAACIAIREPETTSAGRAPEAWRA